MAVMYSIPLKNETKRTPTTGTRCPTLSDEWHGILMPSRIPAVSRLTWCQDPPPGNPPPSPPPPVFSPWAFPPRIFPPLGHFPPPQSVRRGWGWTSECTESAFAGPPHTKAGSTVRYGSKLRYGTKFVMLKVRFEITVRYIFPRTVRFESTIFFSYFYPTFFVPT